MEDIVVKIKKIKKIPNIFKKTLALFYYVWYNKRVEGNYILPFYPIHIKHKSTARGAFCFFSILTYTYSLFFQIFF